MLAFIYADLIVLPLLEPIGATSAGAWPLAVFFASMVIAGIIVDAAFLAMGLVPPAASGVKERITHFSFDYTFWLNLAFGVLALWFFWVNRKHPMDHTHHCCGHEGHVDHGHGDHAQGA